MMFILLFCAFYALNGIIDFEKKTNGFVVYSKKYKRSRRFIYRNGEFRPEYIRSGEKVEDWLNEI
jgi:hypothetical protein